MSTNHPGKHAKNPVSRLRRPPEMSLEAWQIALRKQFAAELRLKISNVGREPVFSEFAVTNPRTKRTYRVAIRGQGLGENFCSCPDFAVNTLGTCKHIEGVLARLRRTRGGTAALAAGFRPAYSEVFLRYGAKREVVFRAGTACPAAIRQAAEEFFGADGTLRPQAYIRFHVFLEKVSPQGGDGHEVRCYDDALACVSQARDRAELVRRIDRAFPDGPAGPSWDGLVKVPLYPYQRQGALFAAKAGRCLIADDMGLGKTIQAIAASEILARHADIRRVLVICPTSLKHQWAHEIQTFSGRPAVVVEGSTAARSRLYAAEGFFTIVNYDVVPRDLEAIRALKADAIILDEAQRIKNWKTRAAQAVKRLESDHAFVLTGTPLENRLEELHSIVEFVDRFRLGPMFRFLHTHQHVDDTGRVVGYRKLDDISRTLEPILVRRAKASVLTELPERLEKRFFVPMTEQQMRHHEDNREVVARIVAKWRRYGYLSEIDQKRLTAALQNMRMSCNSTYLLDGETDFGHKADELAVLLEEILEEREAKVVVFSQWLRMHELIVRRLERRRWRHVLFHGGVPGPKRKDLIARFREEAACRLFLSTDAGGVGLNLQHASVVANMDLPWNPAVLEQRVGRVHRLGQHRPVRVVHFIARGTIEEGMLGLLSFKKSMFAGVLDGGQSEVFLGGTRLKQFMDSVDKATGGIPKAVPEPSDEDRAHPPERSTARVPAAPVEPRPPDAPGAGPATATAGGAMTPQALGELLSAGAVLLGQLGQALRSAGDGPAGGQGALAGLLGRDEASGRQYLKLPLPEGAAAQGVLALLQGLLAPPR